MVFERDVARRALIPDSKLTNSERSWHFITIPVSNRISENKSCDSNRSNENVFGHTNAFEINRTISLVYTLERMFIACLANNIR